VSNLTKCCQQKEKRASHDPLAFWKEDPRSPYNYTIINNPLGMAREYISDDCKIGNQSYNTIIGEVKSWISNTLATATSIRAIFSDNSIPMFSTNTK
jgi:hypothetical protein